jgi:gluconolactonase
MAGLSGCQSAQNLAPVDSALSPSPPFEPQDPTPPYDVIPQLPAPAPGVDAAATKSDSVPRSEPDFEPDQTEIQVVQPDSKPQEDSSGTPDSTPAATVQTKPEVVAPNGPTETTVPKLPSDTGNSGTATAQTEVDDPETKPIEPVFEEPPFEQDPVTATTEPATSKPATTAPDEGPKTGATQTLPTLPASLNPEQPTRPTGPLTLPDGSGEEPLPVPGSAAPRLPDSLPLERPEEVTPEKEIAPQKATPTVTNPDVESLLEKPSPEVSPSEAKPKPVLETRPAEPATPVEKPIPFSGSGEVKVPSPTGRPAGDDAKPSEVTPDQKPFFEKPEGQSTTEESAEESLDLPEFEEASRDAKGRSLPEITPGPTQPVPAETPLGSLLTLPVPDDPGISREVALIRSPDGVLPPLPDTDADNSVRGVEIASFGGDADGIVFDAEGTAFVSHRDSISKVKLDGEVTHWAKTGAPRGHAILRDGTHLICDASERAVLHLDQDGKLIRKIVTKSDGNFLRAPNDLVVDASGGFYFTDPGYARLRNAIGKVHYVAADGTVSVVAQKLAFPEGIALSVDGARLFVAESQKNRIVEFEILSPGEVGPKEVFCKLPENTSGNSQSFVDGLAVDREGWLYVAHCDASRIEVIGPDGDWRTSFACPGTIVKNLAFSRDYSKLFVTGTDRKRRAGRLLIIDFAASR